MSARMCITERAWPHTTCAFNPQACPSLTSLDFVTGSGPSPGTPTVVVLWASYSDADFGLLVDLSRLASSLPTVSFVGVSCDSRRADIEVFVKRFGVALPELKIAKLQVDFPLAFDTDKQFRSALNGAVGQSKAGVSTTLLVDTSGTIVWQEQFSLMHPLAKGQFQGQLRRLLRGDALASNGPCPVSAEDDDDEYADDAVPSDVDSGDSDGMLL